MPRSSATRYSKSTVRTVDDVFDVIGDTKQMSRKQVRNEIIRKTRNDSSLSRDAVEEFDSPVNIFNSISTVSTSLLALLCKTNTYLGGLQATAYFYPITTATDAPWDLFCSSINGDHITLITELHILTNSDLVQKIVPNDDHQVYIYQRPVNDSSRYITIRVFVSKRHPIASILDLQSTRQQSFVSCAGAVCFWPKLLDGETLVHMVYGNNGGLGVYPMPKVFIKNTTMVRIVKVKKPTRSTLEIITGLDDTEFVMFKNHTGASDSKFTKLSSEIRNMVYAVSNESTRYLGNINDM